MRENTTNEKGTQNGLVDLKTKQLKELLPLKTEDQTHNILLKIPDYQRIYCWEEKQVIRLLDDVTNKSNKPYHMGTIILHKKSESNDYDIVDGQQRLVTLTLLLLELEYKDFHFADENFYSEEALKYVAYNKWLIQNYLQKNKIDLNTILTKIQFSALILSSSNLDLAYTFFSANSGRGKSLSDYDLLKSHHLRFIHIQEQAEHVAGRWDNFVRSSENDSHDKALARTFEIYLFRLRKWMRKKTWDNDEVRKIKYHFEAAPLIPNIPPFGEQFEFYESIQGGTHFFAFAEHFIQNYQEFCQIEPYVILHKHLSWEKHWWYRDTIEALVFAYYLKFGKQYINDACMLIAKNIAHHRYSTSRVYMNSIFNYVNSSEIVMMIDQATSPTFFLAELKNTTDRLIEPSDLMGTRKRFQGKINQIKNEVQDSLSIIWN